MTPQEALAAALQAWWHLDMPGVPGSGSWEAAGGWENDAEDILAALDGWALVRDFDWACMAAAGGREKECEAEIARLRAALETARLELMQDVEPDAIIVGIDAALGPKARDD